MSKVNPIFLVIGSALVVFFMGVTAWLLLTRVVRWLIDRFLQPKLRKFWMSDWQTASNHPADRARLPPKPTPAAYFFARL